MLGIGGAVSRIIILFKRMLGAKETLFPTEEVPNPVISPETTWFGCELKKQQHKIQNPIKSPPPSGPESTVAFRTSNRIDPEPPPWQSVLEAETWRMRSQPCGGGGTFQETKQNKWRPWDRRQCDMLMARAEQWRIRTREPAEPPEWREAGIMQAHIDSALLAVDQAWKVAE